jgi:thioredoxin reductase (NADPH)
MALDHELGIIGAGPAGMSAAIYGKRSGLDVALFDLGFGGGTVTINPVVENYLGLGSLKGSELAAKMREHVENYVQINSSENITGLEVGSDEVKIITEKRTINVGAVIIATGTDHRRLNTKGEGDFFGRGVSYCATCDGAFFRNKRVAVVGGGNSAAIEAMYLKGIAQDVFMIHRRDVLRAEGYYEHELKEKGVDLVLCSEVQEIYGESVVKGVKIMNNETQSVSDLNVDGVFISIGTIPRSEIARNLGVKLDDYGYILVDRNMKTNIDRVYAAGDITGGVRQIVTAVGEGARAALSSLKDLGKQYPF